MDKWTRDWSSVWWFSFFDIAMWTRKPKCCVSMWRSIRSMYLDIMKYDICVSNKCFEPYFGPSRWSLYIEILSNKTLQIIFIQLTILFVKLHRIESCSCLSFIQTRQKKWIEEVEMMMVTVMMTNVKQQWHIHHEKEPSNDSKLSFTIYHSHLFLIWNVHRDSNSAFFLHILFWIWCYAYEDSLCVFFSSSLSIFFFNS